MIGPHIVSKVLVKHPIDPFDLPISLGMGGHAKLQLSSKFIHHHFPKVQCKLCVKVIHYDFWHAIMYNPPSKSNLIVFIIIIVTLFGAN
jgi:hypothetical protein